MKIKIMIGTAVLALALLATSAMGAPATATLTGVKGDVSARTGENAAWAKATDGMKLAEGASVKTGANSEVFVAWNGNALKVAPLSSVTLDELKKDGGRQTSRLNISAGKAFAKAAKIEEGGKFEVRTPTAVAGVRGTGFEAGVNNIVVVEGAVAVNAGGQEIMLNEGMMVEVTDIGMSEPVQVPPSQMQELQSTNQECEQVSAQVGVEETKGEAKEEKKEETKEAKGEAKEEAKTETKEEGGAGEKAEAAEPVSETSASDAADAAVETAGSVIENNTSVLETTEGAAGTFEPGNGGINVDIDVIMGY